jgi:hypothetical protein
VRIERRLAGAVERRDGHPERLVPQPLGVGDREAGARVGPALHEARGEDEDDLVPGAPLVGEQVLEHAERGDVGERQRELLLPLAADGVGGALAELDAAPPMAR